MLHLDLEIGQIRSYALIYLVLIHDNSQSSIDALMDMHRKVKLVSTIAVRVYQLQLDVQY